MKAHNFDPVEGHPYCAVCQFPPSNRRVHHGRPVIPAQPLPPVEDNVVSIAVKATSESRAAAVRARAKSGSIRTAIVDLLAHPSRPAMHTEAIIRSLNDGGRSVGHQTVSARVTELVREGWLAQAKSADGTPITRLTSTGAKAAAWELTPAGRSALHERRSSAATAP